MFVIRSKADPSLFWDGENRQWSGIDNATRYKNAPYNRDDVPLPPTDNTLVPMWEVDAVQFARFIAEVQAAGGFGEDLLVDVAASMDLDMQEIEILIDRACMAWDEEKEKIP
jgi:hypothetical protein